MSSFSYLLGMFKSSGDPLVEVAGAYFPAWLAAGLLAAIATSLLWALTSGKRLGWLVDPPTWMLPLWFVIFAGGSWLALFSAR